MEGTNKISVSDDEEELEALRLAALQSLARKKFLQDDNQRINQTNSDSQFISDRPNRYNRPFGNKRGRFFGTRGAKNVPFSNRIRNTNLISITPVSNNDDIEENNDNSVPKLTLPQDRYCGKHDPQEESNETSSKFTRYNNSDESEEEMDEEKESDESESGSPGKLEKSDSLEALMQELDNEIQGKSKEEKPAKTKTKKSKKSAASAGEHTVKSSDSDVKNSEKVEKPEPEPVPEIKPENNENAVKDEPFSKKIRRSPPSKRGGFLNNHRRPRSFHPNFVQNPRFLPPVHFPQIPSVVPPFPPNFATQPPPFYERPISPLAINTEALTTQTMAPLSPRSAAFVLENRAIIEKRKRSPRRSYSRSPSPRLRRSMSPRSPRRSLSPRGPPRRSVSPRRLSRSPKNRSLSPRRRSMSPKRNVRRGNDAARTPGRSRPHIRERLGVKSNKTEETKETVPKKEEKPLDPVLEARKKKFESNEIKVKEGVIRLKPKEEETKVEESASVEEQNKSEESLNEDALFEDDEIELEAEVANIFSDEDSGSENEGRFKTKQESTVKPPVLSFSKLINGAKTETKNKTLPDDNRRARRNNRPVREPRIQRARSRSPLNKKSTEKVEEEKSKIAEKTEEITKLTPKKDAVPVRNRIVMKKERHPQPIEKRFERKIEIKIKNPAKYEKGGRLKLGKSGEGKREEKIAKNVESVKIDVDDIEDDDETEVIIENDSGDEENANSNEGDLRAQLSKKRAKKLHKILPSEEVPSRLLQNALEGAVFKKVKKSKKQELSSSDGKLPIHLRLGIANNSDIFTETKPKRKRKRKSREVQEQV